LLYSSGALSSALYAAWHEPTWSRHNSIGQRIHSLIFGLSLCTLQSGSIIDYLPMAWEHLQKRSGLVLNLLAWSCLEYMFLDVQYTYRIHVCKMARKLQSGIVMLVKWFCWDLPNHSSLLPLVFNPKTQHVSPQYHVIFYDYFHTVLLLSHLKGCDKIFECLFQSNAAEKFIDDCDIPNKQLLVLDLF
jgi:hypothetical protein